MQIEVCGLPKTIQCIYTLNCLGQSANLNLHWMEISTMINSCSYIELWNNMHITTLPCKDLYICRHSVWHICKKTDIWAIYEALCRRYMQIYEPDFGIYVEIYELYMTHISPINPHICTYMNIYEPEYDIYATYILHIFTCILLSIHSLSCRSQLTFSPSYLSFSECVAVSVWRKTCCMFG